MPATLRDVAREAGVSIRTVSRVVNDKSEIADDTKQRVLSAIQKLDYRTNALARSLVSGKTSTIGVIIPQISDPLFPEFVQGVESVARTMGYSVFLCNKDEDADLELESIEVLAANQVDGMILCGSYLSSEQLQDVSTRYNVAIVTGRRSLSAAVVSIPGKAGLAKTTSHLIRLGHRHIGYVGTDILVREVRYDGYANALQAADLSVDSRDKAYIDPINIDTARCGTLELLERRPNLTAIAAYNDLAAVGALQVCRELGRRVPDDLAITGFDDIPLASLVTPSLTTIRVPRHSLGETVMQLLLRVMAAGKGYSEHQEIPIQLIIRDSCGGRQPAEAANATA